MSVSVLRFEAAGLGVEVHSELPGVLHALEAMWRPALMSSRSPDLTYEIDSAGHLTITGRTIVRSEQDQGRLAAYIEGDLLATLTKEGKKSLMLHAGAVVYQGNLVLFLGEANSGKSTMTRAALRQQAQYLTDDTIVFDGETCRGLARSVHFDSFPEEEMTELPSYLTDCDLQSYLFWGRDGRRWTTPIWHGQFETLRSYSPAPRRTVLVVVERGEHSSLRTLSPLERAAALVGASLSEVTPKWGLVPEGPTFHLVWNREPEISFDGLLERIDRPA